MTTIPLFAGRLFLGRLFGPAPEPPPPEQDGNEERWASTKTATAADEEPAGINEE